MKGSLATREDSVVVVIDLQPAFLEPIRGAERIVQRAKFLVECARILEVPVVATVQYALRMGKSHPDLVDLLGEPLDKMAFSCCGSEHFLSRLDTLGRSQAILVGIETHICVHQTTHQLLESGMMVFLAEDGIGARPEGAHDIGMKRMTLSGAIPTHSESVVYEWLRTAEHPKFRDILQIVKQYA